MSRTAGIYADSPKERDEATIAYLVKGNTLEDVCETFGWDAEVVRLNSRVGLPPFPEWFVECLDKASQITNRSYYG